MSWDISRIYISWHISKTHELVIYAAENSDQLRQCMISNRVHVTDYINYISNVHKKFIIISYYKRLGYFLNRGLGDFHQHNVYSVLRVLKFFNSIQIYISRIRVK